MLAKWLRRLADKLDPQPLAVYPTNSEIRYGGKPYKLAVLKAGKELPYNVEQDEDTVRDYFKKRMASELGAEATKAIEWDESEEGRIFGNLKILIYEGS